jgi:hypothetical protein
MKSLIMVDQAKAANERDEKIQADLRKQINKSLSSNRISEQRIISSICIIAMSLIALYCAYKGG